MPWTRRERRRARTACSVAAAGTAAPGVAVLRTATTSRRPLAASASASVSPLSLFNDYPYSLSKRSATDRSATWAGRPRRNFRMCTATGRALRTRRPRDCLAVAMDAWRRQRLPSSGSRISRSSRSSRSQAWQGPGGLIYRQAPCPVPAAQPQGELRAALEYSLSD